MLFCPCLLCFFLLFFLALLCVSDPHWFNGHEYNILVKLKMDVIIFFLGGGGDFEYKDRPFDLSTSDNKRPR